jgi:hypothetical protein
MFSDVASAREHMAGLLPETPLIVAFFCMFIRYEFYLDQFIDSRLQDYPRPRYMFREWVCVAVRAHVFFFGTNFSRNVTPLFLPPEDPSPDDRPFIVLTETKFSFRCIPVWIGTLL